MTNNELADLLEEAAQRLRREPAPANLQLYTTVEAARILKVIRYERSQAGAEPRPTRYRAVRIPM
jgi:hypothetical protein